MSYEATALSIAKEALKPTSGVVDALIAPKLKRVRQWAANRDLAARLDQKQVEELFNVYMHRLLRRVSGVTTLVFPQQILSLPAIYEPLNLVERPMGADLTYAVDQIEQNHLRRRAPKFVSEISITRPGTRTYIVDSAGMGKSTFARHLVMREMVDRDRIPIFLELRRVGDGSNIAEALARDLDDLHQAFDREVFLQLLSVGRFLLVLDGLDEVPSTVRADLCEQIEELSAKADKSAIILTSRPEVALPVMAGARLLTFSPLSNVQATALARRYDAVGAIDVGERLIAKLETLPEQFLRTPLLVALLYRSFGYNGEVSSKISSFYDELYAALYKGHDLTKAGFARPKESGLDFDSFRRLLRGFAFLLIAQQQTILPNSTAAIQFIDDARRLTSVQPTSSTAFLNDLLLTVPLLVRDGPELRFAHKTIGEFFAAEHIAFTPGGADIAYEMCGTQQSGRFSETISFLKELSPSLFKRTVIKPIANAFLAHHPEINSLPIRTLSFLASDSRLRLTLRSRKDGTLSRDPSISDDVLYVQAPVQIGNKGARLEIALSGALPPLIQTAISSIAESGMFSGNHVSFDRFATLPLEEWIPFTDPRLREDHLANSMNVLAQSLTTIYLERFGFSPRESVGFYFNDERMREVLAALDAEDSARSMIRNLLRP